MPPRSIVGILDDLTLALFATWAASEAAISLFSLGNFLRGPFQVRDRFSVFVVWFLTMPPLAFAVFVRTHPAIANGFGSFATLSPLLGWLGCAFIGCGIALRLLAVATLNRQFTTVVSIVNKHRIVETGLYRIIRHPAYLGLLVSLFGFGLASGNWLSLAGLVVLPLAAILYRIQVEEHALLLHFGAAYEAYARRTWRLLPGIY